MADYYAALGLQQGCDEADIKKAYRRLARELHPDVNPDPAAQERFKAAATAYEVLTDPEKRRIVDLGGDPLGSGGGQQQSGGFGGFGGLGDVMDAFFGNGGTQRGPRSRVQPGNDALIRVTFDLEETAFGTTREITVDTAQVCTTCQGDGCSPGTTPQRCPTCEGRGDVQSVQRTFLGQVMTARPCPRCRGVGEIIPNPCATCAGEGRVRTTRTLQVKVPAGVEDGTRIRLAHQGEVGPGGGPAGDLYVEVREREHEVFTRDGSDLHVEINLPMTAAALGTVVPLDTLDGHEEVDIRPGTQSGTTTTLRARGVPMLRGNGRGDLHVHVRVDTPAKLDAEQEALLRQLATLRGEEHPDGHAAAEAAGGVFGKLKHTFTGR